MWRRPYAYVRSQLTEIASSPSVYISIVIDFV